MSLPVKIMERIRPVELIHTPAGEQVLDFGQEMTGWVEFACKEPAGAEVFLQHGEILQNGCFYNDNLRSAKAEYHYISDGTPRTVRPHFTFYGFRHVKVQGMETVDLNDFTGCVLYSQMERTGNIETSNTKVNRLFQNAVWGQKGNFIDTPTDCPQRDERLGWTGDAQVFAATASFNFDTPAFYTKYLYELYEVNMGATTVWERWNSVLPNGSISDTGMNSLNHYAYGSIVEWMYRYLCGLDTLIPGYGKFRIRPYTDRRFDWARMSYESVYGRICSEWEWADGGILYTVEVPFDTEAEFVLTQKAAHVTVNGKSIDSAQTLRLTKGVYQIYAE